MYIATSFCFLSSLVREVRDSHVCEINSQRGNNRQKKKGQKQNKKLSLKGALCLARGLNKTKKKSDKNQKKK